jgi:hypothetical protein
MDTPQRDRVRRTIVATTVVSFSVAALLGIAALVTAHVFGVTEVRILLTTVTVGCASLLVLACLVPWESRWSPVSAAGFLVALATGSYMLVLVWLDPDSWSDGALQALGISITVSVTLAQACLLLGVTVRRPSVSGLVWATFVPATVMAGLVIAMVHGWSPGDGGGRLIGVVAILDVLGTLVAIALGIFGSDERSLSVTFTPEVAARLRARADEAGRPVRDLVDDAVTALLAARQD